MANPQEYAKNMYLKAKNRIHKLIEEQKNRVKELMKDTAVEEIITHEIWSDYLEEIKQHELVEVGKDIAEFGKAKADIAIEKIKVKVEILKQKAEVLKQKLKNKVEEIKIKAKKIYKDTKKAVVKGFNDFKQMKLKEIIEHKYVFLTIEFAKNTSIKIQNVTMQA